VKAKQGKVIIILVAVAVFAGILLASCAAPAYYMGTDDMVAEEAAMDAEYIYSNRSGVADAPEVDFGKEMLDGRVGESSLRHVIRTGSIELTVTDPREKISEVRVIVENSEGMISSSNIYEIRDGQYGANLTLRIPNVNFDPVMEQLQALGRARNVQTGTDDVTMQYIDLQSRLNNQQAQEERLVEILEMAETVEDVLEVERELFRIRGEIETMTAQMNHLQDQVSYATIYLNIREETIPTGGISPGAFENLGGRIGEAFIGSINFVLNAVSIAIIAFSALLPILLVLGITVILIVLLARRLSRRKKAAADGAFPGQE